MRVKKIKLGGEDDVPVEITVTMTIDEAIYIADLAGKQQPTTNESHTIWEGLSSSIFNTFWDEGLEGAKRFRRNQ